MTDTDLSPSSTPAAPVLSVRPPVAGVGMARLRAWRRCRSCGASEAEREAALSGLAGPADTDPTNQRN
jgi:hypothetical protein